jgi:hypothetical protein
MSRLLCYLYHTWTYPPDYTTHGWFIQRKGLSTRTCPRCGAKQDETVGGTWTSNYYD